MTPQLAEGNNQAPPQYGQRASDRGEAGVNSSGFRRRSADRDANHVPGVRKAAILLLGIGEPTCSDLIRQLDAPEILQISNEIARLAAVNPDQMMFVFREFETLTAKSRFFALGGPEKARKLIESAVGQDEAMKIFESASSTVEAKLLGDPEPPFNGIEPDELATALSEENPQTLALILSNLPPEQAGALLASLPSAIQPQVALRIALMNRVSPEIFRQVADLVRGKLKASRQLLRSDGSRALAAILNHMKGENAEIILSAVETENQSAAASVRQLMFIFEDVVNLDQESIKVLIGRVDRKILTMALKGTSEEIKAHFTKSMSQRGAEMLLEDIEALGSVRIRDVDAAQKEMITKIRQLEKEGAISSTGGGGYVV
jgi:flagellar motor switch protein FliG